MEKALKLISTALLLGLLTAGVAWAQESSSAPSTDVNPKPIEPATPLYQDADTQDSSTAEQPKAAELQSKYDSGIISAGAEGTGFRHPVIVPAFTFTQSVSRNPVGVASSSSAIWRGQSSVTGSVNFMYDFGKTGSMSYSGVGRWASTLDQATQIHQFGVVERFRVGRTLISLSDELAFSPESTFGFGGLQGIGNIGGFNPSNFVPGLSPDQSIFTTNSDRLSNTFGTELQYSLTARSALRVGGSYGLIRGIDSSILDGNQYSGSAGYNYRLSASDTFGIQYGYSGFRFPGQGRNMYTQSSGVSYSRRLTARLGFQAQGGAQFTDISQAAGHVRNLGWSGSANANYHRNRNTFTLSFLRAVTGGSGVLAGAKTYNTTFSFDRTLTSVWEFGARAGYAHNASLIGAGQEFNTHFAVAQIHRRIGQYMSAYFDYSLQRQTVHGVSAGSLNSLQHVFSLGFSFSYRPIRLSVGE